MSIPRPTRGMMVELHGGHKDGQRVPFLGSRLRVPVLKPVTFADFDAAAAAADPAASTYFTEEYTLRQRLPHLDGHWFYVLEPRVQAPRDRRAA